MSSLSEYIIDLSSLRHNLLQCKKNLKSKACAVIKADAYGIGMKNAINAIDDIIDFYAVACFREARNAR